MEVKSPRGTSDILPGASNVWRRIEQSVAEVMDAFDYQEIRTPIFEHTELFQRGVGETTDIVEKQMYTFEDRGGRSVTLRPEGTAGVVRSYIQHKLYGQGVPQKLWYLQPMFRYERPQAGRNRQFHQFGAEALGSLDPACDVEMIAIPLEVYRRLGITSHRVLLNSIGCPECRPAYRDALRLYFKDKLDQLCPACQGRYDRNPLRILDCKIEGCRSAAAGAPAGAEFLCDECQEHFAEVRSLLDALDISYTVDGRLVRGLDYYTKTVFEVVTDALGAQDALAAGGRYDGLAESLGGPKTPAVGFGAGMERAFLMLQAASVEPIQERPPGVFVVSLGTAAREKAVQLAWQLRRAGVATTMDYRAGVNEERSMRAQMKSAGKSKAQLTLILGDDELARGVVTVRSMTDGSQREVILGDAAVTVLQQLGGGGESRS